MNEQIDTAVVGGGQAGLAVGYHLSRLGQSLVILDANRRVGDAWRNRWDSLRLFTPARYDGLDGMPFPAPPHYFPTNNEMADYLESYAEKFQLPVRNGVRVESVRKQDGHFVVEAGEDRFEADNVVIAMSSWQRPRWPDFAAQLSAGIRQIHSDDCRNPDQLQPGPVLVAGAGNSGAEIALDVVDRHATWLSGPDTGHVPFRVEGTLGRLLVPIVLRFIFHRVLTTSTPMGRKAQPAKIRKGEPLVWIKPEDLRRAGVKRVPTVVGAADGLPLLEDGQVLEAANVGERFSSRPLLDRPPERRRYRPGARPGSHRRTGALFRGAQVPLFDLLRSGPWGGTGRGSNRPGHRRAPTPTPHADPDDARRVAATARWERPTPS